MLKTWTFKNHDDSRTLVGKTKLWKNLCMFLQTLSRNQLSLYSHKPHVSFQILNPDFGENVHVIRTATVH